MLDLETRPETPQNSKFCVCMRHGEPFVYECKDGCPKCASGSISRDNRPSLPLLFPQAGMTCVCTKRGGCGAVYWCKDGHSC